MMATERDHRRDEEPGEGRPVSPGLLRAQARLQVVLDRKLGRETPDWIREIAEG